MIKALLAVLALAACKETVEHGPDAATPDAAPAAADAPRDTTAPPSAVVQISAGWDHGCLRYADGHVACWGSNVNGAATPPTGAFTEITAGRNTACGLKGQTTICWSSPDPVNPPTEPLKQLAIAEFTGCGIAVDDTLRCWGQGSVAPPTGTFKQISGGWRFYCGLRTDDTVTCWGADYGTVGVPPPSGTFAKISAAHESVCGLRPAGTIECWGHNNESQLPPATVTDSFDQIAAAEMLTCLLRADQTVVCYGNGFTTSNTGPTGTFVAIDANTDFACGIRTDGTALCWDATHQMAVP